ncbi:MAG: membrane protein insertion efficiency factor YidD [Candidatus Chromulinivorax sp.]
MNNLKPFSCKQLLKKIKSILKQLLILCNRCVAEILIFIIYLVRPMLGPMNVCPYQQGCTQFALQELQEKSVYLACWNITKRLLSCHPFNIKK